MKDREINIPNHIAIILDGNGTWAQKRFLPRNFGHKKGAETLVEIVKYANKIKLKYLTVFAFSTENWSRPKEEVDYLMKLALDFFEKHKESIKKDNVKFVVIGRRDNLSIELQEKINELENMTKTNNGLTFIMAFNYGGKYDIIEAVKKISKKVKNNELKIEDITEKSFDNYLLTKDFPDVDLLIRTSNQIRISNFLIWQIAYSELYFTKTLWPDFSPKDLDDAINAYNKRTRRFGGLKK